MNVCYKTGSIWQIPKDVKKYTQFLLGLLKELDPGKALSEFKTKSKSPEEIAELEEYKDKLAKLKADIKLKYQKPTVIKNSIKRF